MVRVGRRRREAGRQPVRDRDRQGVDGSAGDRGRHARGDPCAGGRSRAGRRGGGGHSGQGRDGCAASRPNSAHPRESGRPRAKSQELGPRLRGDERKTAAPAVPMEPFREVRSPERNYGPARLAGGTVVTPLARRLAGEAGIDLANVKGSGPHGRIVARDVETARRGPCSRARRSRREHRSHGRCRDSVSRSRCARSVKSDRTRRRDHQGLGDGACAASMPSEQRRHRARDRQDRTVLIRDADSKIADRDRGGAARA